MKCTYTSCLYIVASTVLVWCSVVILNSLCTIGMAFSTPSVDQATVGGPPGATVIRDSQSLTNTDRDNLVSRHHIANTEK